MRHAPDLVLLRHGESRANAAGLFTGVWDVPLTDQGRIQASRAADEAEAERLNIPTGQPLRYRVGQGGDPIPRTGTYLDPGSAQLAIYEVEREGGT